MTVPSLRRIEGALERITNITRSDGPLVMAATWAWPMGLEKRKGERKRGGGGQVNSPTESAMGHDGGREWDETGQTWVYRLPSAEFTIRVEVGSAGENIMKAAALLEGAMAALDRAAKAAGRGDQVSATKEQQMPRTATKAEVRAAGLRRQLRELDRKIGAARGTY